MDKAAYVHGDAPREQISEASWKSGQVPAVHVDHSRC